MFFSTAVLRKLFDISFSYKHCNFARVCLLVKMASKTVRRSIPNETAAKSSNNMRGLYVLGRYAVWEDMQKLNWLIIIKRRVLALLKISQKALYDDVWPDYLRLKFHTVSGYNLTGAPNDNFRKISVRKTIWDLEFSEHLLQNFLLPCLSWDFRTSKKWYNCPFFTDFYS